MEDGLLLGTRYCPLQAVHQFAEPSHPLSYYAFGYMPRRDYWLCDTTNQRNICHHYNSSLNLVVIIVFASPVIRLLAVHITIAKPIVSKYDPNKSFA